MRDFKAAAFALLVVGSTCGIAACALQPPASLGQVANTTVLDEKAAIGAEVTYTAASRLGATLARAGLIDREAFKREDAAAYKALLAVRSAYATGNANSYATSLVLLNTAAASIRDLAR